MLDVADNLERAAGAVPAEALQPGSGMSAADVTKHLQTLLQGVQLTDKQLTSVRDLSIDSYCSVLPATSSKADDGQAAETPVSRRIIVSRAAAVFCKLHVAAPPTWQWF